MSSDWTLPIAGKDVETGVWDDVIEKWTGEPFARIARAGEAELERAMIWAEQTFPQLAETPAHRRSEALGHIARRIEERSDEIAEMIAREAGKSWRYATGEAARAVETFTFAANLARQIHGETVPMDAAARGEGRIGYWYREPIGPVAAITPFNFPLNLVAHKVAPALAAGCPVVLKPAGTTPLTALILAEIVRETELPEGSFQVLHGSGSTLGKALVKDPRVKKISFTGSREVGSWIKANADLKRVTLELGNNSPVVVDETADLDLAVKQCLMGAYANSGQVCISVQRIYLHEKIAGDFTEAFIRGTEQQKLKNPLEHDSDVGPLISPAEVQRVHEWVREAVDAGATLLAGGEPEGDLAYKPTVLDNVDTDLKVMADEIFGPVVCLNTVTDFEEGVKCADNTEFGLQAGVFTNDLRRAHHAIKHIHAGGIMVNEVPTFRVDHMPYGGMKSSGIGREGVRFAIEEMTEIKMVMIKP